MWLQSNPSMKYLKLSFLRTVVLEYGHTLELWLGGMNLGSFFRIETFQCTFSFLHSGFQIHDGIVTQSWHVRVWTVLLEMSSNGRLA